jgi:hypothetical protein
VIDIPFATPTMLRTIDIQTVYDRWLHARSDTNPANSQESQRLLTALTADRDMS